MAATTDPDDIELLPESGDPKPVLNSNLDIIKDHLQNGPRGFTTTDRDLIASPPDGLTIFNLTTFKLNFYDGTVWREVTST
jgi:hypothetical protein